MFIGNTYIIPAITNLPGQGSGGPTPPPPTYFIISESTGDILEIEVNTDEMISEVAP